MDRIQELKNSVSEKVSERKQYREGVLNNPGVSILDKEVKDELQKRDKEIDGLLAELKEEEKQERYNQMIIADDKTEQLVTRKNISIQTSEEKKRNENYDLGKVNRSYLENKDFHKLDGAEAEVLAEHRNLGGQGAFLPYKRDFTIADLGASHRPTSVENLDIIAPPSIIDKLGIKRQPVSGKVIFNYATAKNAGGYNEGVTLTADTRTFSNKALEAYRYATQEEYTYEYLAQTSMFTEAASDAMMSLDRKLSVDIAAALKADTSVIVSGFAASDSATTLSWQLTTALADNLEIETFRGPAYLMSKPLYNRLRARSVDGGSGEFIISKMDGKIDQYPTLGSNLLPVTNDKATIIHGDFGGRMIVGEWGLPGIDMIYDMNTLAKDGKILVTYSKLQDFVYNPAAFAGYANIDVA